MATVSSSSLIKTILHKSLAEGVFRDVVTRSSNYYYFLGKTIEWDDERNPPYPTDSYAYERLVRSDIITMKLINPNDVAFVIPRKNWMEGTVYDMYDDEYCNEIIGLDIVSGGVGYTFAPTISVSGGGGSGAEFNAIIDQGEIVDIEVVSRGSGYTSAPTVTVTGNGTGADLRAVLNLAFSGANKLEDSDFYVMTDSFNVYKCLDNNNNSPSTEKPIGVSVQPITTSDGYIWKFMYNVPINLRNKFLNSEQIPVISALTNQFYSNGVLDSIIINNKGVDYTFTNITVSGDGFLEEDPVFISSLNIVEPGQNYLSPTLDISPPFSDATLFIQNATVFLGQVIYTSNFDYYEVVSPGTLASVEPTHKKNIVQNGTSSLKFKGTKAKGTLTVTDGSISGVNLIGALKEVNIINAGTGYTSPPSVNFLGGGGSGAQAVCKMNVDGQSILYVDVNNPGDNYTSTPTIVFGEQFPLETEVFIGEQYYSSGFVYTITSSGITGTVMPTHSEGSITSGTATVQFAGIQASAIADLRYGAGYTAAPLVQVIEQNGGTGAALSVSTIKSEAKLFAILENGQINSVVAQNAGIGYTTAELRVTGDGQGAFLTADLNIGNITSQQANIEILTVPGTINAIKMISGGYGYGVALVEITGDGAGATATATIDTASGKIVKINITNPGSGYTFANVVITGNGKGAIARAIMPPFNGHGSNAPDELFTRSLMFYSNVSNDLNQGLLVNNDYRQMGIIKNPRGYGLSTRFNGNLGSGCFIIQASINVQAFPRDTDLTVTRNVNGQQFLRKYRVVSVTSSSALVQSLDNDEPLLNDIFSNAAGQTFTASSVGNPTVDKYSGQMMYIDNKSGFTPSPEETVTLRTVIRF